MKVLMATSWGTPCGIFDYAEQAIRAVEAADQTITILPSVQSLDPAAAGLAMPDADVIWLNYHRALHSRWTPDVTAEVVERLGCKLLVTMHDTRGEAEPDDLQRDLHDLADVFVVHEPVIGLPRATLIRQGVHRGMEPFIYDPQVKAYGSQPMLGTVGFNQGWRQYDELAAMTAHEGWALMILSCNATEKDEARWRALNPHLVCVRKWLQTGELVARLADCDATAFVHACGNTGTSGTIRLGIAARKPVIAVRSRQYRDLAELDRYRTGRISWCGEVSSIGRELQDVRLARVDAGIVSLAALDSWANQGRKYAEIFRSLL